MTQREKDISFVKAHLGASFKAGKKIVNKNNNRYAVVELQDGREVRISLPDNELKGYNNG